MTTGGRRDADAEYAGEVAEAPMARLPAIRDGLKEEDVVIASVDRRRFVCYGMVWHMAWLVCCHGLPVCRFAAIGVHSGFCEVS